jgi:hypothetical protein
LPKFVLFCRGGGGGGGTDADAALDNLDAGDVPITPPEGHTHLKKCLKDSWFKLGARVPSAEPK